MKQLMQFIRDEEGASAIEYALIAGLIAVVIAAALSPLGTKLKGMFDNITAMLP
jgi:Flp pilus assembly protein, pilin Flp